MTSQATSLHTFDKKVVYPNSTGSLPGAVAAAGEYLKQNPILLAGIVAAVGLRLIFWLYTGRIWEDALISLTPARNVWEGVGLTHHMSEPRVHSFTSALGELILIAGEAVHRGLLLMRLASLAAAAAATYFAYRIGVLLRFPAAAHLLVLGFLASDHLQIFFGMAGVETQVATGIMLATLYYFLTEQWSKLGILLGCALICRPEFFLLGAVIGIAMILFFRRGAVRVAVPAVLIAGAWFGFATIYYGSPVPHTIVVKSYGTPSIFHLNASDWDRIYTYLQGSWSNIAPFREFWFVNKVPVSDGILQTVVYTLLILAAVGSVWSIVKFPKMTVPVITVIGFIVYRTLYTVNTYFMWYLPPFMAVLFLLAAAGIACISSKSRYVALAISVLVVLPYAAQFPLTLSLDRLVQTNTEDAVRRQVGKKLFSLMQPTDTVVLEPLGFIGWEAKNKTIYDIPGLGSPIAFEAFKADGSLTGLVKKLNPNYIVLRPLEAVEVAKRIGGFTDRYKEVWSIGTDGPTPEVNMTGWGGVGYINVDQQFVILKRQD